jgi:hypothetical protein
MVIDHPPTQPTTRPSLTRHVCLPPLLGEPKVAELAVRHLVADPHQDVGRLEVEVDDLLAVEVVQALVMILVWGCWLEAFAWMSEIDVD